LSQEIALLKKAPAVRVLVLPSSLNAMGTSFVSFRSVTNWARIFHGPLASPLMIRSMAACCSGLALWSI
jgi:hypothetical protein